MKVTIWDGKSYDFEEIEKEDDIKTMPLSHLRSLLRDVINTREGLSDMSARGLVLDEVYSLLGNEISSRSDIFKKDAFYLDLIHTTKEWLASRNITIPEANYNFLKEEFKYIAANEDYALDNNYLSALIEIIEDLLEEHGISIQNEDRDRDDPDNGYIIYGLDYSDLMETYRKVFSDYDIKVMDTWNS